MFYTCYLRYIIFHTTQDKSTATKTQWHSFQFAEHATNLKSYIYLGNALPKSKWQIPLADKVFCLLVLSCLDFFGHHQTIFGFPLQHLLFRNVRSRVYVCCTFHIHVFFGGGNGGVWRIMTNMPVGRFVQFEQRTKYKTLHPKERKRLHIVVDIWWANMTSRLLFRWHL